MAATHLSGLRELGLGLVQVVDQALHRGAGIPPHALLLRHKRPVLRHCFAPRAEARQPRTRAPTDLAGARAPRAGTGPCPHRRSGSTSTSRASPCTSGARALPVAAPPRPVSSAAPFARTPAHLLDVADHDQRGVVGLRHAGLGLELARGLGLGKVHLAVEPRHEQRQVLPGQRAHQLPQQSPAPPRRAGREPPSRLRQPREALHGLTAPSRGECRDGGGGRT
jgi:hypothetical protein